MHDPSRTPRTRLTWQTMSLAAGLTAAGGSAALLLVAFATELQSTTITIATVALVGSVAATTALAWAVARRTEAPVVHAAAALRTAAPDLGVRTPDAFGDLLDALVALRDRLVRSVETHRQARRVAEQTEAIETEFLTTVSHELRTPLNAILGFSQVLLDELDGPLSPGQREDVETILASGQMLRDLVDEVLDLAAMQSGRFSLARESIDPRSVASEVARLLRGQRGARSVTIETDLHPETGKVWADPRRLRQILTNLGTNALKFTDEGSVTFVVAPEGDDVRLTVADTGSGIRRAELTMIFEEFTQVGDLRRKSQGTGLGLAIVKRLVDLHGGRIEVDSVVGVGSKFDVYLPRDGR